MNEQLKNRLIGAVVLLAVALLMAFLLPKPGHIERDEGVRRVTIDLDGGTPQPVAEGDRVTPPVIAAPEPALEEPLSGDAGAMAEGESEMEDLGAGESRMAAAPVTIKPSETLAQAAPGRVLPAPVGKAPPVQLKQDDSLRGLPGAPAPVVSAPPTAAPSPTAKPAVPTVPTPAPATPQIAPRPKLEAPPARPELAAKPVPAPAPAPVAPAPLPPKPQMAAAKPAPAPVVKPEPAKPEPAAKPEAAKPAGKERWSVQVGSYADIANARTAESKLAAAGLPTQFGPVDTAKGTLYRVRVGPLKDEAAAKAAMSKVTQLGFGGANVRRD